MDDYLVLGSGLSALSFSALMAQSGKSVTLLEAHEHFGGYGHTFDVGKFRFNAQLHYVVGCGEGETVTRVLKRLNLQERVSFEKLNAEGYDRVYCQDKKLFIPYGLENLEKNMLEIVPTAAASIKKLIRLLQNFDRAIAVYPKNFKELPKIFPHLRSYAALWPYRNKTLQEVFDACKLPLILQTLLAGQLIDYMLPPKDLSFVIWAALFCAYCKGAYYPTRHFESVIDAFVESIQVHGGELYPKRQVVGFITEGKTVKGVYSQRVDPQTGVCEGPKKAHYAKEIVCNFDPKYAAQMIGMDKFSRKLQRQLDYDYSYSSFVLYGVVRGLDLSQYGFGDWNVWHCQEDHNKVFERMYAQADYTKPYFAMNCRSLHTPNKSNCPDEDCQIFQICTVANYEYWKQLKLRDRKSYNQKKQEVLDCLLDAVEAHYVPKIRQHLIVKMTGSPTSNERFVWAPYGGSYGVNLTPRNFSFARKLGSKTSLKNFHFCSAASGYGGFCGAIYTGMSLYENLSKDKLDA